MLFRIIALALLAYVVLRLLRFARALGASETEHFSAAPFVQRGFLRWRLKVHKSTPEWLRSQFYSSALSMIGAVARADGIVKETERSLILLVLTNELGLTPLAAGAALHDLHTGEPPEKTLREFARDFYTIFHSKPLMLENMLDILIYVALADREMNEQEEKVLRVVAAVFQITNQTFRRLIARNEEIAYGRQFSSGAYQEASANGTGTRSRSNSQQKKAPPKQPLHRSNLAASLEILGCSTSDSIATVKKKYRKLALELHPDRHQAQGLPTEMQKFALERFRQVQEAYDFVISQMH